MLEYINVGSVTGFEPGIIKSFRLGNEEVAVVQADGRFYAFSNYCTHLGGDFTAGYVAGDEVVCTAHYAAFNLDSGDPSGGPAVVGLRVYEVKVEGDDVYIATE